MASQAVRILQSFELVLNTQILPIPNDSLKILDVEGCQSKFRAKIECKFTTPDEVDNFIEKYNNHNSETLRLSSMKTLSEKAHISQHDICDVIIILVTQKQ